MKSLIVVITALVVAGLVSPVWAETSPDEKKIEKNAADMDRDANEVQKEKVIVQKLEKEFAVDDARIKNLRDQKMGFGEIAITLSLAKKLPGGVTDVNVNKIISLREGTPKQGWGEIAKKLGVKLGEVQGQVERVERETHKEIEKAERQEHKRMGKGEKADDNDIDKAEHQKPENMEKPERMEKMERPGEDHDRNKGMSGGRR